MAPLSIPTEGLVLRRTSGQHDPHDNKHLDETAQVIRLDLVETVTKEILRSLRNNEQVRLRCGKNPMIQYGKKSKPLEASVDNFPSDVFTKPSHDPGCLYFSGRLSHTLEVQQAKADTASSDAALAALESNLKSLQEERASNETSIIGGKEDLRHAGRRENKPSPMLGPGSALRKDHRLGVVPRSAPSSPFLTATYSPRQGPTSAPLSSGMAAKARVRLDAMRIPLVHLLAVRPMTLNSLCDQLRAPKDDCEKLLDKVARDCGGGDGLKELKEKSYRELDVYKFQYRSEEDRQAAIGRAIQAYDRMRVEKRDPLWQLLLPQEERGKGKILSRLNFDKPALSQATPKHERPHDDSNEAKAELSDRDPGKARATKNETVTVQKRSKDKVSSSKTISAKVETSSGLSKIKDTSQSQTKPVRQDGKFKSSERIEDSDEEADAADEVIVAKPKERATTTSRSKATATVTTASNGKSEARPFKSVKPVAAHTISSPKHAVHKSSLSSSSSSGSGNEKPRTAVPNSSTKSLKPHPARSESTNSRISPRPRHNSSPQKPSPLGSSPPTTSTDLDNSSSSKASNQSSAPSSPPSDSDMPKPKQAGNNKTNKYSPVISDASRNVSRGRSPNRSPVKRKAARPLEDERPAKRPQQENPTHRPVPQLPNGATTTTTQSQLARPGLRRTDSDRSSSPEKPGPDRKDVIDDARRFQKYYKKYKDLYERISKMDEKERDDKDMGDLWKMHKRLKEMKAEIWNNWDKVEKISQPDAAREMVAV